MRDIPYSLNLMDADGDIIASGDLRRVGQAHPGAVAALTSGEPVEIDADAEGARPGINLAHRTRWRAHRRRRHHGPPGRGAPAAQLVPSSVTLLIGHQQALLARADRQGRRDLLAERLVTHVGEYPALLVADAGEFGLDLRTPHEAVLVEGVPRPQVDAVVRGLPRTFLLTPALLGFLAPAGTAERAASTVLDRLPQALCVVGPRSENVAETVGLAREAGRVAARLGLRRRLVTYAELDHLCRLARGARPSGVLVTALAPHPDLLATVRAVVRHDGNLAAAASELCIHRNTLTYRLDRIQELTGRDPRRLLDAVAFVSEIVREP